MSVENISCEECKPWRLITIPYNLLILIPAAIKLMIWVFYPRDYRLTILSAWSRQGLVNYHLYFLYLVKCDHQHIVLNDCHRLTRQLINPCFFDFLKIQKAQLSIVFELEVYFAKSSYKADNDKRINKTGRSQNIQHLISYLYSQRFLQDFDCENLRVIKYQRMNKFKFEPPQEHRRSLQQGKNDFVGIYNVLEKCTQVLREDRLFLRNEIKGGNPEVLNLFKQYSRPSQMQQLQVKLRKHVQNVKNRLKNEQLVKFKETLNSNTLAPQIKRVNQHQRQQQPVHQQFKQQISQQKPLKPKGNSVQVRGGRSLQNALRANSSMRHFQQMLKCKYNQDIIEQRQSQNVTSARLGRTDIDQPRPKPLQEQFFDSIQNKLAGRNNFSQLPLKHTPWDFENKAKKTLYQYQPQQQNNPYPMIERSRQHSANNQQREDSIFDKHFYGSEKSQAEFHDFASSTSNFLDSKQQASVYKQESKLALSGLSNKGNHNMNSSIPYLQEPKIQSHWTQDAQIFKLKQSDFRQIEQRPVIRVEPSLIDRKNSEENLFTPMQLLNQCRNFLKNRDNSNQKSRVQNMHDTAPLQLQIFPQKLTVQEFQKDNFKKADDSNYMYPEIKDSHSKISDESSNKNQHFNYIQFETFANSQGKKLPIPSFQPQGNQLSFTGLIEQKIPSNFSIEDFLMQLMEITEMNPFISPKNLAELINNHPNSEVLKRHLKKQIQGKAQVCLTYISEILNEKYNQQNSKPYPYLDQSTNSVYDLLDIDQKGFIAKDDIDSFLTQIESAEVENYQQISEQLWRLFDGADFTNEHKLTYWHLYLVKNSDEFERVSRLLSEFEFQIERSD